MRRRRILLILPSFDTGGAENYALRLIKHAGNKNYEWHVTTGNLKNARLQEAFLAAGALIHTQSTGYLNPRKAFKFWQFVRKNAFSAVVSFNGVFSATAMLIAWLNHVPSRVAWHRCSRPAHSESFGRRIYQGLAQKIIELCSTKILSNSKGALDYFHPKRSQCSDFYEIIPNGVESNFAQPKDEKCNINLRRRLGIPDDARVIGHIGRFSPAKDHATLLEVVRRLHRQDPKIKLLVAGTGTDSPAFAALVCDHELSDVTYCLGSVDNVSELYPIMDVFLFTSVTEGQPNALIEAMLSGVPIAFSDIASNRETVPPGNESNMFVPGNVDEAIKVVRRLLRTPPLEQSYLVSQWARERYDASRNFGRALEAMLHEKSEHVNVDRDIGKRTRIR